MHNYRVALVGALLAGAVLSNADVMVNTFGSSGVGYFPSVGWTIDSGQSLGKTFTISDSYYFTDIDVALRMDGETDQMLLSLHRDAGGQVGSTIESFTLDSAFGAGTAGVYSVHSSISPLLDAGTYYVTIEPLNGSTGKWNLNNGGGQGAMVVSNDGGSSWSGFNDTNGAIRVQGVLNVPEPLTVTGMSLGVLALLRRRRR